MTHIYYKIKLKQNRTEPFIEIRHPIRREDALFTKFHLKPESKL